MFNKILWVETCHTNMNNRYWEFHTSLRYY